MAALNALRDLRGTTNVLNHVVPIIEPVRGGSLGSTLSSLVDDGTRFAFLMNPRVGEFTERPKALESDFHDQYLQEYDNYYPAMYVDAETSAPQIASFASRYSIPALYFLTESPSRQSVEAILACEPAFVAVREGNVPLSAATTLSCGGIPLIRITDPASKRPIRSADYPNRTFFSDAPARIDPLFRHFGDYSIIGDRNDIAGGMVSVVALHHVYAEQSEPGNLYVAHYKSRTAGTDVPISVRFEEALQNLLEDQVETASVNRTQALGAYMRLAEQRRFAGLSYARKLAVMQHIEVVSNVLEAM
jgi:hypothetical protein